MSKEKNGRSAGMHVGSASIVMIFAILCLTKTHILVHFAFLHIIQ